MSDPQNRLVALVFDDPYKADEARAALRRMADGGLLEIGETALIEKRADGKIRMSQDTDTVDKDKPTWGAAELPSAYLRLHCFVNRVFCARPTFHTHTVGLER